MLVSPGSAVGAAIVDNLLISVSDSPSFRPFNSTIPAKAVPSGRTSERILARASGVALITHAEIACYGKYGVTDDREGIMGC